MMCGTNILIALLLHLVQGARIAPRPRRRNIGAARLARREGGPFGLGMGDGWRLTGLLMASRWVMNSITSAY